MEIHEQIDVRASPADVWTVLADPYAVAECVPGAEITGVRDDGQYDAKLGIKFGPTRIGFAGRLALDLDPAAREGRVTGRGRDGVGGTKVQAEARFRVHENGSGSRVTMDGNVDVSGRLATFIEAGANMVVKRMSAEFAARLAKRLDEERRAS